MAKIKVTQKRSTIGRTVNQKRTVRALGLKRISDSAIHNESPQVLGMIDKVKHLIEVEKVK
ncbi:MAG: 50S ribosomal protein L30 [Actinobacteria bacterium]|nr:MAG: 50S ribosomal protein L30 [Actinomycetota bacterium]